MVGGGFAVNGGAIFVTVISLRRRWRLEHFQEPHKEPRCGGAMHAAGCAEPLGGAVYISDSHRLVPCTERY